MKKTGYTLVELLVTIAIIAILLVAIGAAFKGCSTSEGSRAGIVTKLSNKGLAIKSWEGELMLGNGSASSTWAFSISNDDIAKQVQEALKSGKRVELRYKQSLTTFGQRDTPYDIVSVEKLE